MSVPVVISSNIKRTSVQIDKEGNEIDPKTKQIIKFKDKEYIPTKEEIESKINIPAEPAKLPEEVKGPDNPLAALIRKKVEQAVADSISKIDIGAMVEKAINDAFK